MVELANVTGLKLGHIRELEVEAYYVECTEIDSDDLDGEFIRVAIRTEQENELVFAALKDVLA